MKPIEAVARDVGLTSGQLSFYGKHKAKVSLDALVNNRKNAGKLVLVSAMTPTPHGEGKTVISIGLAMGLRRLGRTSVVCVRQPSLGPTFGIKGGGAGGGKATVEPAQEVNLRLTGDIDAVGAAHNLLSSVIDNHVFHGNDLSLDPERIVWPRALDVDDRSLRKIRIGLDGEKGMVPRDDEFVITAASEVMAVLCLSETYADLKARLGRMIVAYTLDGKPVRCTQMKVVGSMAALLKDAMLPNLVQTAEETPAIIHGGPFANIAHGTSSLVSIKMGLGLAEYCVVEAGFATDLGAEKFVDIVARVGGLNVDAIVVVASVRALRHHGGAPPDALDRQDRTAVTRGLENLTKHVENARAFGLDPVVAINKFPGDSEEELREVADHCRLMGVAFAASTAFAEGGAGAEDLARLVVEAAGAGARSKPLYSLDDPLETKIEKVVKTVYGGEGVAYLERAEADVLRAADVGLSKSMICVAKTSLSLSDDSRKLGRPRNFSPSVRRIEPAAGAGFNVIYMGDVVTMPGLPRTPAAERVRLSDAGEITGVY